MRAKAREFLAKGYRDYYAGSAFSCVMFLIVTAMFAIAMISAVVMLERQWRTLEWPRLMGMVLIVAMSVYPWVFELRAHREVRRLVREERGEGGAKAAAASYSLTGLAFAYAVIGWAFSLLASARIR